MIAVCDYSLSRLKCIIGIEIAYIHTLRIIIELECVILLLLIWLYHATYNGSIALECIWLGIL